MIFYICSMYKAFFFILCISYLPVFGQNQIDSLDASWKNIDLPDSSHIQAAVSLGGVYLE